MTSNTLTSDKFLSDAERAYLEETLHRFKDTDQRNSLILFLLLYTGARPSEILNVQVKDVNWLTGSILFRGLKGSRDRDIPLAPWLLERLKNYRSTAFGPGGVNESPNFGHSEKLFPIAYNTLGDIWRKYRPCKKTLRSTRHTFAVTMYRKSKDARTVQKMLGHRWLSTTEVYLDYVDSEETFRKLICG